MNQSPPAPPPAKKGLPTGCMIALVIVGVLVFLFVVLGILGWYGTQKYLAAAKGAEAKNAVGLMGRYTVQHYEEGEPGQKRPCGSASQPVPVDFAAVRGKKYQSSAADWGVDAAADAGFACMRFEMTEPQYFQYAYQATPTTFTATGKADLDGDGEPSMVELTGQVVGDQMVVAPTLREVSPGE